MSESQPRQQRSQNLLGSYRIEEELGSGGMGTVYRAYHMRLARPVALKKIRPELEQDPTRRRRFLLEARAAARISHPNIVQVYDILKEADSDWIVMELVEGVTVARLLQTGPVKIPRALSVALDIARGLAAAHSEGIVHRDLKAENVIITPTGQAKILDFGIAKLLDVEDDDKTAEQRLVGTPRAMSPEQMKQASVDHRSDLFSFGTLLYELVTGKNPFHGKTFPDTLLRVCVHVHKPVQEYNLRIPQDLSLLIDSLLEKDPRDRPQSIEEIIVALQSIIGFQTAPVKVLFVDDEPDFERLIRQVYRKDIKNKKIFLEFAKDGQDALIKIKTDELISIVISDINMPRMDGLTLLDEINSLGRMILTIMLSAYGDMKNIRTAMNLGAFDFLTKPMDFRDLEITRQKALSEIMKIQNYHRLREENDLLNERNRFIRSAFGRYLRKRHSEVTQHKDSSGTSHGSLGFEIYTLRVHIVNYQHLPKCFNQKDTFDLISRIFEKFSTTASNHGGAILQFHRGTFLIGFGLVPLQETAYQLAETCALALESAVESIKEADILRSSQEFELRVEIDSKNVRLQDQEFGKQHYPTFGFTLTEGTRYYREILQDATLVPDDGL